MNTTGLRTSSDHRRSALVPLRLAPAPACYHRNREDYEPPAQLRASLAGLRAGAPARAWMHLEIRHYRRIIERPPIARYNEARPQIRVRCLLAPEHLELRVSHRFAPAAAG